MFQNPARCFDGRGFWEVNWHQKHWCLTLLHKQIRIQHQAQMLPAMLKLNIADVASMQVPGCIVHPRSQASFSKVHVFRIASMLVATGQRQQVEDTFIPIIIQHIEACCNRAKTVCFHSAHSPNTATTGIQVTGQFTHLMFKRCQYKGVNCIHIGLP